MAAQAGSANIEIQRRDVELLLTLFECRVMTRPQAAILHFDGKPQAAKKRLQLLKAAGYLADRRRLPHEPAVLTLTPKGFELLKTEGELQGYPSMTWERMEKRLRVSPLTIAHEVDVMEFRAAFVSAVRERPNLAIIEFCTWPAMIAFDASQSNGESVNVRPDGFIRLRETSRDGRQYDYFFFLEVDRSTESQQALVDRAHCYQDFYRRGGLATRRGKSAKEFKSYPFRVLVVCRSQERRNNFAARLHASNPAIKSHVWITTMAEALQTPVSTIWVTPADHRRAAGDHPFTPHQEPIVTRSLLQDY